MPNCILHTNLHLIVIFPHTVWNFFNTFFYKLLIIAIIICAKAAIVLQSFVFVFNLHMLPLNLCQFAAVAIYLHDASGTILWCSIISFWSSTVFFLAGGVYSFWFSIACFFSSRGRCTQLLIFDCFVFHLNIHEVCCTEKNCRQSGMSSRISC